MKSIFVFLLLIVFPLSGRGQESQRNRCPGQVYLEDSTHVFWTWYPNPFSPPGVRDTTTGLMCRDLTFFCDLTDSVQVAMVEGDRDIVNEATVTSNIAHDFSVCYWVAGPHTKQSLLPPDCFKRENKIPLSMLLIVKGRKKCLALGIPNIPQGWYCWIDEGHRRK